MGMRSIVASRLVVLHTKGTLSARWLTRHLACPRGHVRRPLTAAELIDGLVEITVPAPDLDWIAAQDACNQAAEENVVLNYCLDICGYHADAMTC